MVIGVIGGVYYLYYVRSGLVCHVKKLFFENFFPGPAVLENVRHRSESEKVRNRRKTSRRRNLRGIHAAVGDG